MYNAFDSLHNTTPQHSFLLGRTHPAGKVLNLVVQSYNVRGINLSFPGSIRVGEEGGQQVAAIFWQFVGALSLTLCCFVTVVAIT